MSKRYKLVCNNRDPLNPHNELFVDGVSQGETFVQDPLTTIEKIQAELNTYATTVTNMKYRKALQTALTALEESARIEGCYYGADCGRYDTANEAIKQMAKDLGVEL